jgi:eukaryotic-like serine/threonine-protein kinase
MTPERWQQIRGVLGEALELPPEQRSAFLQRNCSSDPSLRQEVETLLASSPDVRSSFLQSSPPRVTLTSGTKLGDYEVKSLLGAGGMGEVYRARDARLGRDVAIKVLPLLATGSDRLRRFEQEARAAAALNHPNILAVFQMGTYQGAPYLVSELLEGETLREQLKRGPLSVRKAVGCGVQIAHGLAAAHEKGIVHRDLKPENLFVTREGRVKILDFGLAKLTQPRSNSDNDLKLTQGTEPGVVMGTVGYMAPEQVRGQTTDPRADIFAFGAILYEMLAGKRAFQKPTSADTMSAILNEDPPEISQVTTSIPPALQRVVHRCLEKNPEQRFQSASDLAFALEALSDSQGPAPVATAAKANISARKRWKIIVPVAVTLLALMLAGYIYSQRRTKLTDKDTIVVAEFANSTGDPIFDDTLKQALTSSLVQSPFLNVMSDSSVSQTFGLMTKPANTRLTPQITQEVCQRANGKAWIEGSIGSIGSEYIIGLKAVNCQNGDTLAQEQVTATGKEKVLDALGDAASQLRRAVGESLTNVNRFDVPLAQATTSSLEALKAASLGEQTLREQGTAAALPFFQHAVELDPNFATGYLYLGKMFSSSGQAERARELFAKAYSLRQHASEREKFDIDSIYYESVSGDLEGATRVFREWLDTYPRDQVALGNLATVYDEKGQYDQALELDRESLRQEPNDVGGYLNLAVGLIALNRFSESRRTLQEALDRKLDDALLHYLLWLLPFFGGEEPGMAGQVAWSKQNPESIPTFLYLESSVAAHSGHLRESRKLNLEAMEAAEHAGNKEGASRWRAAGALREAAFGNLPQARQIALTATSPPSPGAKAEGMEALVLAWSGDIAHAEAIADGLARRFPQDTLVQSVVLPTIRARIELSRNNPERSIELLQTAAPYELTGMFLNNCIYPVYVRGQAYLAAKQGAAAAAEFQKILDHRGLVGACETGALAHLGLGRASALRGDTVAARSAYKDFLTLWKDADPDIPILKEAKREYAELQ